MFYSVEKSEELNDLKDVNLTNTANGDVPIYNSTTQKFENGKPVKYGTTAGTACEGNDSRLSNKREPTSHASSGTGYGVGSSSNYGHLKVTNDYNVTTPATDTALSQSGAKNLYTSVNSTIDTLRSDYMLRTHGTIVCVGDSWGEGIGAGGLNYGWVAHLANRLGRSIGTGKGNVIRSVLGGTGMKAPVNNKTFTELLQDAYNSMNNAARSDTTLVIAAGGTNDRPYGEGLLCDGTIAFVRKAKQLFPNANIFVFNISGSMTTSYDQALSIEGGYSCGAAFTGAAYGNITNLIKIHGCCSEQGHYGDADYDYLHLNSDGYSLVAGWMISYIMGVKPRHANPYIMLKSTLWPGNDLGGGKHQPQMMVKANSETITVYAFQSSIFTIGTTHSQADNPRPYVDASTPVCGPDTSWWYWLDDFDITEVTNPWGQISLFKLCTFEWTPITLQGTVQFMKKKEGSSSVDYGKWLPATFHLTFGNYTLNGVWHMKIRVRVSCVDTTGWIDIPENTPYSFVISDGRAEFPVEMA